MKYLIFYYKERAVRKFLDDEDDPATVTSDLLLSVGWKAISKQIQEKMNRINALNRCQLLSLFKRLDSLRNNLDEDEEAKKQVVIMITLVTEALGREAIKWDNLAESEVEGIMNVVENVEMPVFAAKIIKRYLSKAAVEEVFVDKNQNEELKDNFNEVLANDDQLVDTTGLEVLAGASTVQKLQMIIKNTEVVKTVKLLEPLVQDLKRISFDEEGKESHEKKKYVKEIMRNCRSINDILGSLPEF